MKRVLSLFTAFLFMAFMGTLTAVPGQAQQHTLTTPAAVYPTNGTAFRTAAMGGPVSGEGWSDQFALSGVYDWAHAVAVSGDDVFVGGFFDFAGTATNAISIVRWDAATETWSALGSEVNDVGVFTAGLNTGEIFALAVSGNRLYVGGDFEFVGDVTNPVPAQRVAVYDMTTETWSALGTGMNGIVHGLEVTDDGSIVFAGGDFDMAGGQQAARVAQINTTSGGNWQPMDTGFDNAVFSLQLLGNELYAGGQFENLGVGGGGATVNGIARWDGVAWQPLEDADGDIGVACPSAGLCGVTDIVTDGTDLFLSGWFTVAGGETANRIATWSAANNAFGTLGNGFNNQVNGLALNGTTLYATGFFTQSGAVTVVNGVASYPDISVNNGNWMPLGAGIADGGTGRDVAVGEGSLYLAGIFEQVGGLQARGIAQWDVAGQAWQTLTPEARKQGLLGGFDNIANRYGPALGFATASTADAVYVGGSFQIAGTVEANHLARWDPDTGSWSTLGDGVEPVDGQVHALAVQDDLVFVGGSFTEAGGQPASNIAAYDMDAGQWDDLGGGSDGAVRVLKPTPDGRFLFAGGTFTTIGGVAANNIAVLELETGQWAPLGTGTDAAVLALELDAAGNLYAGGDFQLAGGGTANRIARWPTSSVAPVWQPLVEADGDNGVSGSVTALEVDGTDLLVGGAFLQAGTSGQTLNGVARWSPGAQTFTPLGDGFSDPTQRIVWTLINAPDGKLYAGGQFTQSGSTDLNNIAQWDEDAEEWLPLGSGVNGPVISISSFGTNDLYIAGEFFAAGPHAAFGITRYTSNAAPVAVDDVAEVSVAGMVSIDVLANDSDPDGDPLTVAEITTPPTNGTVSINSGQSITYTSVGAFTGEDTFVYRISDGKGGTAEATVTVTVSANATLQLIHNASGVGVVDIYLDGTRVADDLAFREGTPFFTTPSGEIVLDVTDDNAADNSAPLFTETITLQTNETYVGVALGEVVSSLDVVLKSGARTTANDGSRVEFFIVHGAADAPALDIRRLDTTPQHNVTNFLASRLGFGEVSDYTSLAPTALVNIDAVDATDPDDLLGVFRFDLSGMAGETFTLLVSGERSNNSFALVGIDAAGNPVTGALATAVVAPENLPTTFTLAGNYPNPFNPATSVRFDLPEAARVTVAVYDLLGRHVLVVPAKQLAAGANRTLTVDASSLGSGVYVYQVIAQTEARTQIRTGRMTLIK